MEEIPLGVQSNYVVAIRLAKWQYFSSCIASSECHPAELFQVVRDLLQPGNPVEVPDCSSACCDEFAIHFEGEITQICNGLDSTVTAESEDVSSVLCLGQVLMDEFQFLRPEDVNLSLIHIPSPRD